MYRGERGEGGCRDGIYRGGWNTDKKLVDFNEVNVSFMFFTTQGHLKSTSIDNFITGDPII